MRALKPTPDFAVEPALLVIGKEFPWTRATLKRQDDASLISGMLIAGEVLSMGEDALLDKLQIWSEDGLRTTCWDRRARNRISLFKLTS